jgi:hypothetical protein
LLQAILESRTFPSEKLVTILRIIEWLTAAPDQNPAFLSINFTSFLTSQLSSDNSEIVHHCLLILDQLLPHLISPEFPVTELASAVLPLLSSANEPITSLSLYLLAICSIERPEDLLPPIFNVFSTNLAIPISFALNGFSVAMQSSPPIVPALLERGFGPICCALLTSALSVASAALRCLTAVAALGYDSVAALAVAAVADSGIVNTAELFHFGAEFCALCLSRPALTGTVLRSGILLRFCEAAESGSFETRRSAFELFEAASSSDEFLRVIAEGGGARVVVESLDSGDRKLLPLLLRLLAAAPTFRAAAREVGADHTIADLTGDPDSAIADLAAVVLDLLDRD